jgi:peptide deformylase
VVLDIITYDSKDAIKLRKKCIDVKKENPNLQKLINNMFDTLKHHGNGVGLAAPQVGYNLNLFIVKTKNLEEVFINPKIKLSGTSNQNIEGCLSVPNMQFPVTRREIVNVKFFDKDWNPRIVRYTDFNAIVIQHEYDHLIGKLIID